MKRAMSKMMLLCGLYSMATVNLQAMEVEAEKSSRSVAEVMADMQKAYNDYNTSFKETGKHAGLVECLYQVAQEVAAMQKSADVVTTSKIRTRGDHAGTTARGLEKQAASAEIENSRVRVFEHLGDQLSDYRGRSDDYIAPANEENINSQILDRIQFLADSFSEGAPSFSSLKDSGDYDEKAINAKTVKIAVQFLEKLLLLAKFLYKQENISSSNFLQELILSLGNSTTSYRQLCIKGLAITSITALSLGVLLRLCIDAQYCNYDDSELPVVMNGLYCFLNNLAPFLKLQCTGEYK